MLRTGFPATDFRIFQGYGKEDRTSFKNVPLSIIV